MIREAKTEDIDRIMKIWLSENVKTHSFVPKSYWEEHFEMVKEMLPQAELYVYEEQNKILGFIGLMDNYIAGIFVDSKIQSKGIGKQLLDYVKDKKESLILGVYQKNERAIKFYQRENFVIQSEDVDEDTGEYENIMLWKK